MPRPPETARSLALKALRDIDVKEAYANLALDAALDRSGLEPRDRGLATELVYGVTRRRATLDWYVDQISTRPVEKMDPYTANNLRMAAYQLLYLTRIPQSAVVNEAVELAKRHGHEGLAKFINGVLRNLIRRLPQMQLPDPAKGDPARALAVRHSHPEWLAKLWVDQYGLDEAVGLLEAGNVIPPLTIRVNRLKTTREKLIEQLATEGVEATPARWSADGVIIGELGESTIERLKSFKEGLFIVQDESSMLVAPVLDPQPGETVLDVAAAPGGKTTHIAERMGNQGRVIALDIHPHKIELIEKNANRLGITIIDPVVMDAREAGKRMRHRADRVLCDVPCAGLGTLARRPDARWRKEAADFASLVPVQNAILESAAQAVKPGGVLVYSTCSIGRAENQEVVEAFVAEHPEFAFDNIAPYLPEGTGAEGGYVQLLPHKHGTDGFFIARMRRKAE